MLYITYSSRWSGSVFTPSRTFAGFQTPQTVSLRQRKICGVCQAFVRGHQHLSQKTGNEQHSVQYSPGHHMQTGGAAWNPMLPSICAISACSENDRHCGRWRLLDISNSASIQNSKGNRRLNQYHCMGSTELACLRQALEPYIRSSMGDSKRSTTY